MNGTLGKPYSRRGKEDVSSLQFQCIAGDMWDSFQATLVLLLQYQTFLFFSGEYCDLVYKKLF